MRIHRIHGLHNHLRPFAVGAQVFAQAVISIVRPDISKNLLSHIDELDKSLFPFFFGVFCNAVQHKRKSLAFGSMCNLILHKLFLQIRRPDFQDHQI